VHCLDWSKSIGWDVNWPQQLHAYRALCHARPAYQRAKALRDANIGARRQRKGGGEAVQPNKNNEGDANTTGGTTEAAASTENSSKL
jgi:hypothetical protein